MKKIYLVRPDKTRLLIEPYAYTDNTVYYEVHETSINTNTHITNLVTEDGQEVTRKMLSQLFSEQH